MMGVIGSMGTGMTKAFGNIAEEGAKVVQGATKQIFTEPIKELGHVVKGGSHGAKVNIPELSGHFEHTAEAWGESIGVLAHQAYDALHHSQGALHAMANHYLPSVAHAGHGIAELAPVAQLVPYGAKFFSLVRDVGLGTAVRSIFS